MLGLLGMLEVLDVFGILPLLPIPFLLTRLFNHLDAKLGQVTGFEDAFILMVDKSGAEDLIVHIPIQHHGNA